VAGRVGQILREPIREAIGRYLTSDVKYPLLHQLPTPVDVQLIGVDNQAAPSQLIGIFAACSPFSLRTRDFLLPQAISSGSLPKAIQRKLVVGPPLLTLRGPGLGFSPCEPLSLSRPSHWIWTTANSCCDRTQSHLTALCGVVDAPQRSHLWSTP
jgi:hypothetical protein